MNPVRLDRLTALLEGLGAKVTLASKGCGLSLHLVQSEPIDGATNSDFSTRLDALSLLICPPEHEPEALLRFGERCYLSFEVTLDGPMGPGFLAEFSRPVFISMKEADPSLLQVVALIVSEMQVSRCGQPFFINRAGDILLIGLMRHLTSQPQHNTGLFNALSDHRIAKSLVAIHTNPAHPWTLELLAELAGMSRTSFANYFKRFMQVSPGKYLENLRLAIARQLVQSGIGLKQIATRTGYASPSTLSRALSREIGRE